jgi:hypothetical protein
VRADVSRGWLVALLATVTAVVLVGVLAIVALTSGGDTLVLDLDVGECFDLPDDMSQATLETVATVDCDDAHEAEVFADGDLNPDRDVPYPGEQQLFSTADRECAVALSDRPELVDRFGILPVVANQASWDSFQGRFVCVAIPYGGGTTVGSLGF